MVNFNQHRQLLDDRAAMLKKKKSDLPPFRAVFTETDQIESVTPSKETLARQLFRESQVQQIYEDLDQVEAALLRIDQGEYGLCTECGCSIQPGRLLLLPATEVCLSCA